MMFLRPKLEKKERSLIAMKVWKFTSSGDYLASEFSLKFYNEKSCL